MVHSFEELIGTPFCGEVNAICWERELKGDYDEFARVVGDLDEITSLEEDDLMSLLLSSEGQVARRQLIEDLRLLQCEGLQPSLDLIPAYPKADSADLVPVDVYDLHADSATVPTDTLLCSYTVAASEGFANDEVERYVDVPEIRSELLKRYGGEDGAGFCEYLKERFYDLHYRPLAGAKPYSFGFGNMWRIATQCPDSPVAPCIHRAPTTEVGQTPRLLLIS
ncbi:hypothetical protein [Pelagicoccus mobilis]|uniref:hypothetical protein n=1 Tax=Pelagicoccus mobilis TaxID=415221 RepID=UPI0035EE7983